MKQAKLLFFILAWSLGSASLSAQVRVDHFLDGIDLSPAMQVLVEMPGMTAGEISAGKHDRLFAASTKSNFGFSKQAIWVRLPVESRADSPRPWILSFAYALLDRVELYYVDEQGLKYAEISGDSVASILRSRMNRDISFHLIEPPHSRRVYYLRITSESSLQLNHFAYTPRAYEHAEIIDTLFFALFFGGLIAMGLYNMSLALSTRSEHYLFYGFLVFMSVVREAYLSGMSYQYFLFDAPKLNEYVGIYSMAISVILANTFISSALSLARSSRLSYYLLHGATLIAAAQFLMFPLKGYAFSIKILSFQIFVNSALVLYVCIQEQRRGYKAARFLILAWVFALSGWTATALTAYGVFPYSTLTKYANAVGQFFEIMFLSFALSDRINTLRVEKDKAIKALNKGLENQVREKTQDIQSILDSIPLGILKIDGNCQLKKGHSKFMEPLIHASIPLEGSSFKELILARSELSSDEIALTMTVISSSVNDSELQWMFNSGLLPHELRLENRIFELQWSPIFAADEPVIKEILLLLKDVTELRSQEIESQRKKKENEIILSIIKTRPKDLARFMKNAQIQIATIRRLFFQEDSLWTPDDVNEVWRILHTLKGISRSLGFRTLSAMIHDIESLLQNLATGKVELLKQRITQFEDELREYVRIDEEVLRRSSNLNLDLPLAEITDRVQQLETVLKSDPARPDTWKMPLNQIKSLYLDNLSKIAVHQMRNFAKIAEGLGKPLPILRIQDSDYFFDDAKKDLMDAILVHLFRNSLDHGIERPEERERLGKRSQGDISLNLQTSTTGLRLRYQDDGRGLCLTRIKARALDKGLLAPTEACEPEAIAAFIFYPGFSTSEKVTEISGRGVGMDAVRNAIELAGGSITIELAAPVLIAGNSYAKFSLDIRLPWREALYQQAV